MTANGFSDDKPSVLIVDDDDNVRYLLHLLFEVDGFEVTEASNGAEAVWCALQEPPQFVVLDCKMPGMGGDKAAPMLRSIVPHTRIVAFSSQLDDKPEWADAFLNKQRISEVSDFLMGLPQQAGPTAVREEISV